MFSLICALNKRLSNNPEAGDLRRHRDHYDVIVKPMHLVQSGILVCEIDRRLPDLAG